MPADDPRSVNTELATVNEQLREKLEQVETAHAELNHFLSSTKIATVLLDDRLCLKRFTPAAGELLGVDDRDIGRNVAQLLQELLQSELVREARSVLDQLNTYSRELRTSSGRWISRQVLPYRTNPRHIEGVVVTFVDITDVKRATERLALNARQHRVLARIGLRALRENDLQGFMDQVVLDVQQVLDADYCKILEVQPDESKLLLRAGVGWQEGAIGTAAVSSGTDSQAGYTLRCSEPIIVDDLATEKRFSGPPLLADHGVRSGISCIIRYGERPYGVLGAHSRSAHAFGEEDAGFLKAIARVLGSEIDRSQSRMRLALELEVAHVLNDATDLGDALPLLLDRLVEETSAATGAMWRLDPQHGLVRDLHRVRPDSHGRFPAFLTDQSGNPGAGLAARVFRGKAALWWTNLGDPALLGDDVATPGLVSGFGLPILSGEDVLGVITVFSGEHLFADDALLQSLTLVGHSIGDFVRRIEYEQRARRLAAITASSHDAILSYLLDGSVTEWLVGAERLFGYSAEEMVGNNIKQILPPEREQELWTINQRITQGEVVEPFETTRVCKDGRQIAVSVRSSPVYDHQGHIIGISSTDRDITRQKDTERKLLEADRQKDEFLAMLGHELRNPLAAIRGATELLKLTHGDAQQIHRAQAVLDRQSSHMAKLLDGLLDVSRIIRGKIHLEVEVTDLRALCQDFTSDTAARLGGRDVQLRTELPLEPIWIEADPVRVVQIVDKLISNALKYTPDGGNVVLTLTRKSGTAVLSVRDTGMGIDPELLPHVFDVFRQSKQSLDRSGGGLGLGLALVKSLVDMHGGDVEARSAGQGQGAEFLVRLPTTHKAPPSTSPSFPESGALRILIVEDNEDTAAMLKTVLELSGHEVVVASSGQEGIALAREHLPNVVLCDIGLPDGTSGFDVAKQLRADPQTRHLAMIALTGYGRPEDKRRCEEAGFNAHLTKPVDAAGVNRALEDLGRARGE